MVTFRSRLTRLGTVTRAATTNMVGISGIYLGIRTSTIQCSGFKLLFATLLCPFFLFFPRGFVLLDILFSVWDDVCFRRWIRLRQPSAACLCCHFAAFPRLSSLFWLFSIPLRIHDTQSAFYDFRRLELDRFGIDWNMHAFHTRSH